MNLTINIKKLVIITFYVGKVGEIVKINMRIKGVSMEIKIILTRYVYFCTHIDNV